MAAPKGNQNAAKAKQWAAAIERALDKRGAGDRLKALSMLAEKLIDQCEEGSLLALKELGDRLDGKPAQAVAISNQDGEEFRVSVIKNVIVDPKNE